MQITDGNRANVYQGKQADTDILTPERHSERTQAQHTSKLASDKAAHGEGGAPAGLSQLAPAAHPASRAFSGPDSALRDAGTTTPTSRTAVTSSLSPERETALNGVAADFKANLALARDNPARTGAGWVQVWVPSRGGATSAGPTGAAAAGGKQGGVMPTRPDKPGQAGGTGGQYVTIFSESAFRDAYVNQGGGALQALAQAYGSASVPELLQAHPELRWTVLEISGAENLLPPALNGEGPPPAWIPPYSTQALMNAAPTVQAMMQDANAAALAQHQARQAALPPGTHPNATAEALHAIDAVLCAPSNQQLLTQYSGHAPSPAELDPAKVATYGVQRAQVMALLERAQWAAGVPPAAPAFRGEAPVSPEWLVQRSKLAQQLSAEFEADYRAGGTSTPGRGALSTEPLVRADAWRRFLLTSDTAVALARHLGVGDATAVAFVFPGTAGGGVLAKMADPTWRGGPAPAGMAMGSAEAIGSVDLALSDPDNQALIQQFGGPPPTPSGGLAHEQVRLYGLTRYQAMTQLSTALAAVRQDYLVQLNNARLDAANPAVAATLPFLKDDTFSVEAFTAWYQAQPGAAPQAFTRQMGPMSTREVPDLSSGEAGRTTLISEFAQSPWQLTTSPPRSGETPHFLFQVRDDTSNNGAPSILSIDPQAPPELNDFQYVGFDASLGWITPRQNLHRHESTVGQWVEGLTMGIIIGGFAWAGGVAAAAGATGTSVGVAATALADGSMTSLTGLIAAGAASGATAAALGGVMGSGSFRWKDVLKGAFTGAFTAGLAGNLKNIAAIRQFALANPVAYSAMLGGSTQALLGESFKQGVLTGFANGVAGQVTAQLNAALLDPGMSPADAARARVFIKALDSAIRIAADPSNPSQAFASAFLGSIVNDPALHPQPPEPDVQTHPVQSPAQIESTNLPEVPEGSAVAADGDPVVAGPGGLSALSPSSWWIKVGESLAQRFFIPLGEALSGSAMAAIALLAVPSNLGSTERSIQLNDNRRFVLGNGADYGRIEVRNEAGHWVPDGMGANYRMINVNGVLTPMTDAQQNAYQATLHAPTSVPWSPPAAPPATSGTAPAAGSVSGNGSGTAAPIGAAPSPAPTPVASPSPAPAAHPSVPAPAVAAPAPAPSQPPAAASPVPIPAPAAPPAQMAPIETPAPLPGYGDAAAPPATTAPPLNPPPTGAAGDPLIVNPIHIPPSSSPPASGSTTPVTGPSIHVHPQAPVETWDDSIIEARPSVDEPTYHYPIRDDFDNHLSKVDTWRGGGGHNEANFLAWVGSVGGIYEIRPTAVAGIHDVYAVIPHPTDPSKVLGVQKTTYDQAVFSDAEMNRMAREAGKLAWDRYQAGDMGDALDPTKQTFYDVTVDGTRFRAYVNPDAAGRPSIGNVHPINPNTP